MRRLGLYADSVSASRVISRGDKSVRERGGGGQQLGGGERVRERAGGDNNTRFGGRRGMERGRRKEWVKLNSWDTGKGERGLEKGLKGTILRTLDGDRGETDTDREKGSQRERKCTKREQAKTLIES